MRLQGEQRILLELEGAGFEMVPEGANVSPYHLLAASLASCTVLVLISWAAQARLGTEGMTASVEWEVAQEGQKLVTGMRMEIRWPGLPPERLPTAERVADLCPIHGTLERGTAVSRRVSTG